MRQRCHRPSNKIVGARFCLLSSHSLVVIFFFVLCKNCDRISRVFVSMLHIVIMSIARTQCRFALHKAFIYTMYQ